MSSTEYARDRVLRIDKAEAGVLARAVMASIEHLTETRQGMAPNATLDQEIRTLRSLLERLSG